MTFCTISPAPSPLWYTGNVWLGDQNSGLKWLGDNLSILRIFTNFWMPSLSMYFVRRGSEGTEPEPLRSERGEPRPRCLQIDGLPTVGEKDRTPGPLFCKQGA